MKIAILGAGAIGTLFAHHFARAGHDVTLVARGARLEALREAKGVVKVRHSVSGAKDEVAVSFSDTIPSEPPPDLLLVAVRRQHADGLLADVARSRAARIMFMFNAATDLSRFRDAVGGERFSWGFPAAVARFDGDVLVYSVVPAALRSLQITTIGGLSGLEPPGLAQLRDLLSGAKIPHAVCADMESWLRTHAAFMAPLISAALLAGEPRARTWTNAARVARAMDAGFRAVRRAGSRIVPRNMALLRVVPTAAKTFALWRAFRSEGLRAAFEGGHARGEAEAMLRDLEALSPEDAPAIADLRGALSALSAQPPRDGDGSTLRA